MPEYKREDARAKWVRCRSWDQVRAEIKGLLAKEPDRSGFYVRTDSHKGDESRAEHHRETRSLFEQVGQATTPHPAVPTPEVRLATPPELALETEPTVAPPGSVHSGSGPLPLRNRIVQSGNLDSLEGVTLQHRPAVVKTPGEFTNNAGTPLLVGLVGTIQGRRFTIDGPPVTLGRSAECEIVLDHAFISREHATFETARDGGVVVRDLGSAQGTYVNGDRIQVSPLHEGDVVGVGPEGILTFRFEITTVGESFTQQPRDAAAKSLRLPHPSAGAAASSIPTSPKLTVSPQHRSASASETSTLRIGRAPDNDLILSSPSVSRYHAQIDFATGRPRLSDVGSLNGTFVNGIPLQEARILAPTDLVFLGGFLLHADGHEVSSHDLRSSRLTVSNVTQAFGHKTVLHEVSFAIFPREFVGIMGPSGCGKSTLMDALNGLRPAKTGSVWIDELNLYQNFNAVRRSIGYVPQRDILHNELTVQRTLHYAAMLRLPEHISRKEARNTIDDVIKIVGLTDQRDTSFKQLSGGQQKRLSLAIELLTKPSFLFLDEPTSPLDPETSENLMVLFRQLADEGRILVMVTHKFEKFEKMHQIVLLTKGGHLAYFGPPKEALKYFDCEEPSGLYRKVGSRSPEEVSQTFKNSTDFHTHVVTRLSQAEHATDATHKLGTAASRRSTGQTGNSGFRQWRILTRRYLEVKLKDSRNTLILLGQAPLIAVILAVITSGSVNDAKTLFIGAVIAVWFGGNNAIREIVAEFPIYKRERMVNLKILPYLGSKFSVLGVIAVVQCFLFVETLVAYGSLQREDMYWIMATLSLTAIGGVSLGILCSAVVNSTEKAMSILPLILIPQLLLSGFMKPLDDYYVNAVTRAPATQQQFLDYEQLRAEGVPPNSSTQGSPSANPVEPVTKVEGLGGTKFVSTLILARWSVDALVHSVSRTDGETRDRLAGRFYVAAYDKVWDDVSLDDIEAAFRFHTYLDWLAVLLTIAAYLTLAGVALKRKDSL